MASPRRTEAKSSRDNSPPTCNGEWKARNLAMASERRVQGEEEQRAKDQSSPWRTIYSRGELRRPKPSELTWQKPTGEETSTRHCEHILARRVHQNRTMYKSLFLHFQWGCYHTFRERIG